MARTIRSIPSPRGAPYCVQFLSTMFNESPFSVATHEGISF